MSGVIEKFNSQSLRNKALIIFYAFVLSGTFVNFVIIPTFQLKDAKVFAAAVDLRIGWVVKREVLKVEPAAAAWSLSLEPDDLRRSYVHRSPGTAHFYAEKINGAHNEKMSCRYETKWSRFFQIWPDQVVVTNCITN